MPRLSFIDIITTVENLSNVKSQRTLIKNAIQMGIDRATATKDLEYLMTEGFITTVAPYTTGTVTATNGSTTITGLATAFTSAMAKRKIRIGSEQAYYRIASVTNSTTLVLEVPYQGTTASAQTFSIYKDEYRLPTNCNTYKILKQIENGIALTGVEASAFDVVEATPSSEGHPSLEILTGTKLDTYTTGTISGTANTSTITGVSTEFTSVEGLGNGSRLTVGTQVFTVKSVDSNTQLTIYESIVTAFTTATYSISLDNLIVQLFDIPHSQENIYFRYQRIAFPLVGDTDIPDMPEQWHWILVHSGLAWAWMTKDKDEALRQEVIFGNALKEFWKSVGSISLNRKYPRASQDDIAERSFGGLRLPEGYGRPFSL